VASVETGDTAAVCLSTEATKDWPHGRRVASHCVLLKRIYSGNAKSWNLQIMGSKCVNASAGAFNLLKFALIPKKKKK